MLARMNRIDLFIANVNCINLSFPYFLSILFEREGKKHYIVYRWCYISSNKMWRTICVKGRSIYKNNYGNTKICLWSRVDVNGNAVVILLDLLLDYVCSVHLKTHTFQMCITRLLNIANASKFSITRVDRLCLHIHW